MLRNAFAITFAHLVAFANQAHDAHMRRLVNTSLSETLFFLLCWCIREEVHSIPDCTQRLSHLTSEGNMAKKAKKAKKAKSAVKKTAKKTRKVAKKKK